MYILYTKNTIHIIHILYTKIFLRILIFTTIFPLQYKILENIHRNMFAFGVLKYIKENIRET